MPRPPHRNPNRPAWPVLPNKLKAVHVVWVDSATTRGWDQADLGEPTVIHSVGIEVGRTDKTITLSTSFNGGSMFMDQISIPLASVKRISRIL
jgi:hypothetical protein